MAFHLKEITETPARRISRHRTKREAISARDANKRARQLLGEGRISATLHKVLSILAVAGVLSEAQLNRLLGVSGRSLRRYHKRHLLDRLYVLPPTLRKVALEGADRYPRLYKLGLVGLAITRHEEAPVPTGYDGFGVHRLAHDVLANEVLLRILLAAAGRGYDPIWLSKYEATVKNDSGRAILEPDGMLLLQHAQRPTRRYLLEYHNEDDGRRSAAKIRRYEEMARDGHWQSAWQCDELPTVLVCWTHNAVATGYRKAIEHQAHRHLGLRGSYLGMPLARLLEGHDPLVWKNFLDGTLHELVG